MGPELHPRRSTRRDRGRAAAAAHRDRVVRAVHEVAVLPRPPEDAQRRRALGAGGVVVGAGVVIGVGVGGAVAGGAAAARKREEEALARAKVLVARG